MASKEMTELIERLEKDVEPFPTDLRDQRARYEGVFAPYMPEPGTRWEAEGLSGIGGGNSEWVWHESANGSPAACMYFHGGGYTTGMPRMWRQFNGRLSRATGARVLAVDYRLAPEHPFPAAAEDAVASYLWLLGNGYDPKRIALVGDSAGGGLVLVASMMLRDRGLPLPAAGVPMSPWTDLALTGETYTTVTDDPLTTREMAEMMATDYLSGANPQTPLASPLYGDLTRLPPTHIEAGTRDILYGDSVMVADALREAGNDVSLNSVSGALHIFPALCPSTPEAADAIERMAGFLRNRIGVALPE